MHLAMQTFVVHIGHRALLAAGARAGLGASLVMCAHLARLVARRCGRLARLAHLARLARLAHLAPGSGLGKGYGRGQTEHEKDCQQMLLHSWFSPLQKVSVF
jgi:hypothetical protein